MTTINDIKTAIKTATSLDALCEALAAAELHIQERRDAGDMQPEIADYCDVTSLPAFGGHEPADTTAIWSWDAERLLTGTGGDWVIEDRESTARIIDVPGGYCLSDDALDHIDTTGPVHGSIRDAYAAARDLDYTHVIPIAGPRRSL